MTRIIFSILVIFIFTFSTCEDKKSNQTKTEETETMVTEETKESEESEVSYRFIASFYSPGNGIDHKMKTEFTEFLTAYEKKASFEKVGWGKEGEVDFCFELTDFSKSEQDVFVEKATELLKKSSRVRIYENQACKHKR